jgi:hypothetical protein
MAPVLCLVTQLRVRHNNATRPCAHSRRSKLGVGQCLSCVQVLHYLPSMVIHQLQPTRPSPRPISIPAKSVILLPMSKYTKLRASLIFVPLRYILLLLPCVAGVLKSQAHRLDDHPHHLITTHCNRTLQDQNLKPADGLLLIPAKPSNALLMNTSLSTDLTSTDCLRDQS